jgi:hypothetical protein
MAMIMVSCIVLEAYKVSTGLFRKDWPVKLILTSIEHHSHNIDDWTMTKAAEPRPKAT